MTLKSEWTQSESEATWESPAGESEATCESPVEENAVTVLWEVPGLGLGFLLEVKRICL